MTGSSLLQVGVYLLVLVALVKPLGAYMARVFEGERTFFTPVVGPVERLIYRLAGVDPSQETDWRHYALAVLAVNFVGFVVVYALQRLQGFLPLEPAGLRRCLAGLVVQHRGQLRIEHQLAGLRRRDDDELSHAGAGPRRAELPLRRHRHRRARRAHPRPHPPRERADRQLLGRLHAHHALRAPAPVHAARHRAREPGRRAEHRAVPHGRAARAAHRRDAGGGRAGRARDRARWRPGDGEDHGHGTDRPARTRRQPDRDQAARHERGRILQRQLGASLREPDAACPTSSRCWRSC